MLLFVFLYRAGEGFLLVEAPLFMQAGVDTGGLGLCATEQLTADCPHWLKDKAMVDGFISTTASIVFGILGGMFISKRGLSTKTLLLMAVCLNVPHLTLVYLSQMSSPENPLSLTAIATLIAIEKAGYSFGFVANMLYMMQQISPGKYHMTHYAFCTAIMNLALVPTQMVSGPLADALGYKAYFVFVMFVTIPSLVGAWLAPFPKRPSTPDEADASSSAQDNTATRDNTDHENSPPVSDAQTRLVARESAQGS
jgi:PAT family beta-lactamase induction signal transducer AmpG